MLLKRRSVLLSGLTALINSWALGFRCVFQSNGFFVKFDLAKTHKLAHRPWSKRERKFYFEKIKRYSMRYHLNFSHVVRLIAARYRWKNKTPRRTRPNATTDIHKTIASLEMTLSMFKMRSTARPNSCTSWRKRKTIRRSLFFYPMQLLIQGQWWSKVPTHRPQSIQWRTRSYWSNSQILQCLETFFKTEGTGTNPDDSLTTRLKPISPSMIWESKIYFSWGGEKFIF